MGPGGAVGGRGVGDGDWRFVDCVGKVVAEGEDRAGRCEVVGGERVGELEVLLSGGGLTAAEGCEMCFGYRRGVELE